jgi:membrane-bound serine protease (ClpP class)
MDNLTLGFILIGVALVLTVAEFLLPSGGVFLVLAGCADLVGLVMVFYYGDRYLGFATLAIEAIILPLLAGLFVYIWPRTPMGRRMMVRSESADETTIASMPANLELEPLRGRLGRVVTLMRPAGAVEFDGRRVDCLSEGLMIEPDTWVRCIDVKAGKVIVRPVEKPNLGDLETASFED